MKSHPFLYIDYSSKDIAATAGIVDDDNKLQILGSLSRKTEDVNHGIITKSSNAAFKTGEVIKLLYNYTGRNKFNKTSITVNARSMKNIFHTVDKKINGIITKELLSTIEAECRAEVLKLYSNIHIFEAYHQEYFIDGSSVTNPIHQQGKTLRIEFNLIIGDSIIQENIRKTIERTGQKLDYILLGINALSTAILDEKDKANGIALISFERSTTTLAIYAYGKLQEYIVMPLGGDDITNDIKNLGINFENAEKLKTLMGVALFEKITQTQLVGVPNEIPNEATIKISTTFLSRIIEARLEEILEPIIERIYHFQTPLRNGIIVSGGGSKLLFIDEYIEKKTGIVTRLSDHSKHLDVDAQSEYYDPEYATTVGAFLLTKQIAEIENDENEPAIRPVIKKLMDFQNKFNKRVLDIFSYDDTDEKDTAEAKKQK